MLNLHIKNASSLLTTKNLRRIKKYIRLFGFKITFNELRKKLWQEKYYLYSGIKLVQTVIKIEGPEDETNPYNDTTISVVIPVKNGGEQFRSLLSSLKNQKGFKDLEIIVVDSGSEDESIEIAKESDAKFINISPEEFSHSYSRNLGAKNASGEYILFTVQDAQPTSDSWLQGLISVIKNNDVVAVSCAEIPRAGADLFYKAISWSHLNFMEIDNQDRIMTYPNIVNHISLKKNAQLNNIACLINRNIFKKYEFRGTYAEDLDLGIRLIRDGYKLALISSTKIIHSHNRSAYHYLKRGYIEHLYYYKFLPNYPSYSHDVGQLISEIVFIYRLLHSLVCIDLKDLKVPLTIKNLSRFVIHKLYNAHKISNFEINHIKSNGYIDNNYREFLVRFFGLHDDINDNYLSSEIILLDSMQSYTTMILEFMDNNYIIVDHELMEDFKYCLFNAYAFICGIHLASCYWQGSDNENEIIMNINYELTQLV